MKIKEVRVYQHDIEVAGGLYQMSISEVTALDTTVVAVETDTGLIGYGETCPLGPVYQPEHALGARAAIAELAPGVIGIDPRQHRLVYAAMDARLTGHNYAKSPIDVACWDLAAKAADVRLCDLLGGASQDPIPSYYGIMPGEPAEAAATANELQDRGFARLQIKTGGRELQTDVEVTRAVAAVTRPGVKLLADANRGWNQRDAILFSQACQDIPLVLEQPCSTYEENAALVGKVCHPLFLDESADSVATVMRAIDSGVAQGFGMKLSRVGGISKIRTVIDMCAARSVPMTSDDTWGGDITNAATAHVGASIPSVIFEGTWIGAPYTSHSYPMTTPPITNQHGHIEVPDGPGLGVEPAIDDWPTPVAIYR